MKRVECDHCGDTVVVPNEDETVTRGETPVEHMKQTGHAHKRKPRLTACPKCGNVWFYTGSAVRATCPNCRAKVPPGHVPDEVDDAYAKAVEE